ncbi:sensor histidine kinase [Ramlibacter sp. MMS24-I3-19]|uniref:sensor histidine kinase n=1 Tax=Ramlibacter sp. MMS24-I3-19 TaxID=3416606 RepID=UPI003D01694F
MSKPREAAVVASPTEPPGMRLSQPAESPDPDAQLRVIHRTSTVWLWEQDAEFRFTLDLRGRDHADEDGSVIGRRRWESPDSAPLVGTWDDHRRWCEAHKPFRDFEFRVVHDGTTRFISTTGVPVYAPDGSFAGYRGTAMDVTELKIAREESERAQSLLRLASHLGRIAAWSIEVPSMRASWSSEFLQLLDVPPSQPPTIADVFSLVRRRTQPEVDRAWKACLREGTPFDLEVRIFTRKGRAMWMRLLGEATRDAHGAITRIEGAAQDVTQSKEDRERLRILGEQLSAANAELTSRVAARTRDLERANTELKGFAHALAHDLKQPMVAVQWFSAALDDAIARSDQPRAAALSASIKAAGLRMTDYVDALLSVAETSQAPLNATSVNLSAIAGAVLDELQGRDPSRRVDRDIEPGMVVRGDPRLLRMLLENLLGNAWKFTAGRDVSRISLASHTGPGGETVYVVQDNGAGFDMAWAGKLFGNFQRLHSAEEYAGTGIGLANAQRIVVRHGGRIWAEGRLGEGATFSFTLGSGPAPAA